MAVYVELQEDELDEYQQSKHNILSSFWQIILDIFATKKYCILLTFVLLINTVIIIVIANKRISNKVNELSMKNEGNLYEYESSDLPYGQLLLDYTSDISEDQSLIELDDLTTETINYMIDEQSHNTSSESADKPATILGENN